MSRILVVEDDADIRQLVRDVLEHAGFDVLVSADGQAGLEVARTRRPDLIVLDLGLPGLDGLDVTRSLRRELRHAQPSRGSWATSSATPCATRLPAGPSRSG